MRDCEVLGALKPRHYIVGLIKGDIMSLDESSYGRGSERSVQRRARCLVLALNVGLYVIIRAPALKPEPIVSIVVLKSLRLSPPTQWRRKHESLNAKP